MLFAKTADDLEQLTKTCDLFDDVFSIYSAKLLEIELRDYSIRECRNAFGTEDETVIITKILSEGKVQKTKGVSDKGGDHHAS